MAGLIADPRKTAIGAAGLAALALWFAASGGPADSAVNGAAALAQRQPGTPTAAAASLAAPTPAATPASWFAPDDSDEPLVISMPERVASDPPFDPDPNIVRRPPPIGPDFPPGNR